MLKTYREVDLAAVACHGERWFRGELDRPLFNVIVTGNAPTAPASAVPYRRMIPSYGLDAPLEPILAAREHQLSTQRYLADGFPMVWPDFGAGALAAFVGGEGRIAEDGATVWFEPGRFAGKSIAEIAVAVDWESPWLKRCREFLKTAREYYGNRVMLGQTDIGGVLDVVASLRTADQLLFDLYDHPEEVKRLSRETIQAWIAVFDCFEPLITAGGTGQTGWWGIPALSSNYMIQCDFAYMISPEMFQEFAVPDLTALSEHLDFSCYHMDGVGQFGHLEHLVRIPGLNALQLVPGAGKPPQSEFRDEIAMADAANLQFQVFGPPDNVRKFLAQLKNPARAMVWLGITPDQLPETERLLREYGAW